MGWLNRRWRLLAQDNKIFMSSRELAPRLLKTETEVCLVAKTSFSFSSENLNEYFLASHKR